MIHLYVFSLGHSGSTILNIALAAAPGAVSVGEAEATIRRAQQKQHRCTCGAEPPDCPLWGPFFRDQALVQGGELQAGYQALYRAARDAGGVTIMVDSSKHLRALEAPPADPDVQRRVIFLVRDPRGYFVSHYHKWRRSGARRGLARELALALASWWYGNRKILRALRSSQPPYLVLSYEELVLDTPRATKSLSEFLGRPVSLEGFGRDPRQLHILRGNALRHDPERSTRLVYDYRWFYDPWVRRLGFVFAPLLRWGVRRGILPRA